MTTTYGPCKTCAHLCTLSQYGYCPVHAYLTGETKPGRVRGNRARMLPCFWCGGNTFTLLGTLGTRTWLRCSACGMDTSRTGEQLLERM